MYTPKHFSEHDLKLIQETILQNSFAVLISLDENKNIATSHLPLSAQFENNKLIQLRGHFARSNPHWKSLATTTECTILFQGPHTYISPLWYRSGRDVPTWNYCVVKVQGRIKMIEDFKSICGLLKELTETYESPDTGWRMELPADLKTPEALTNAIVGFEIDPFEINAKFKLSQNRPLIDQQGVIEGLTQTRTDADSLQIATLMRRNLELKQS